jgi:hypothetical protein
MTSAKDRLDNDRGPGAHRLKRSLLSRYFFVLRQIRCRKSLRSQCRDVLTFVLETSFLEQLQRGIHPSRPVELTDRDGEIEAGPMLAAEES